MPYGAGKELLLAFDAKSEDKRLFYRNMKRAQQYMVNLFSYEIKRLSGMGAVWRTESGVIALREEYYDEAFGVQFEEQQNAYCMI